jgi:hypothetical protein
MPHEGFTRQHCILGRAAAFTVSFLLIAYAGTLVLGLLSLKSSNDPIGDPYFSILELLIVVIAPLIIIVMVAVYFYASSETKMYSLIALAFMVIMAAITCSVHFVILTVSRQIEAAGFVWASLFFSFKWPSVVYALDILAWDFFFALSMLFGALVFKTGRLEKSVRILMIINGLLSLAGLIGVPLADMNIRNIGIIGYVGVSIVMFPLMGVIFGRTQQILEETERDALK